MKFRHQLLLVDAGTLKSDGKQLENGQDALDFVGVIEPLGVSVDAQQAEAAPRKL